MQKKQVRKETERRQATVISAEIYGYREMMEKLDAEEAASNMNVCFEMFAAVVEKYGGKIDKIMESSLTALFGVPAAIEEAPKQAVNAAIEMRHRVRDYSREHGLTPPLDIHTGINTGLGIAGDVSGPLIREFAVMGDPVEVASRLTDLAPAGRV